MRTRLRIKSEFPVITVGDYVDDPHVGRRLMLEDIEDRIGELIVLDSSTSARRWYKVVQIEKVVLGENDSYLIYYDGKKQRGRISKWFLDDTYADTTYSGAIYELKPKGSYTVDGNPVFSVQGK